MNKTTDDAGTTVLHRHLNDPDKHSLEIGTPGKGGAIKTYVDIDHPESAIARIDRMLLLRAYASSKMEEIEGLSPEEIKGRLQGRDVEQTAPAPKATPKVVIQATKPAPEPPAPEPKTGPKKEPKKTATQKVPSGEFQCADCGCDISNVQKKVGETFVGRPVCSECLDKHQTKPMGG